MSHRFVFIFTLVPTDHMSKLVSTSRSSILTYVPERWGNSFHILKPCMAWQYTDIEAIHTARFNIIVWHANTHSKDGEIGMSIAIIWQDFPFSIIDDMGPTEVL